MSSDPGLIVAVFDDDPGGYLPIGEFADLLRELDEHRQRVRDMAALVERKRIAWFLLGVAVGGVLAQLSALAG